MTTNSDFDEDEQHEGEERSSDTFFDRRRYLKLASATALTGLGSGVLGSASAAEGDLARTLTITRGSGSRGDIVILTAES